MQVLIPEGGGKGPVVLLSWSLRSVEGAEDGE